MTDFTGGVRAHLVRALDWENAHVNFDRVVDAIPPGCGECFAYSLWALPEHLRIAQDEIVEFCTNPAYALTRELAG